METMVELTRAAKRVLKQFEDLEAYSAKQEGSSWILQSRYGTQVGRTSRTVLELIREAGLGYFYFTEGQVPCFRPNVDPQEDISRACEYLRKARKLLARADSEEFRSQEFGDQINSIIRKSKKILDKS